MIKDINDALFDYGCKYILADMLAFDTTANTHAQTFASSIIKNDNFNVRQSLLNKYYADTSYCNLDYGLDQTVKGLLLGLDSYIFRLSYADDAYLRFAHLLSNNVADGIYRKHFNATLKIAMTQ